MITNILKRKWISNEMLESLKKISNQFTVYVTKYNYDIIPLERVGGRESFVRSINIEFNKRCTKSFTINSLKDMEKHFPEILNFVKEYEIEDNTQNKEIVKHQENAIKETISVFNINNNIDNLQSQITFHLNDYNKKEREKILSYLSVLDDNAPDAIITLDFSKCDLNKLDANSSLLLMVETITQTK